MKLIVGALPALFLLANGAAAAQTQTSPDPNAPVAPAGPPLGAPPAPPDATPPTPVDPPVGPVPPAPFESPPVPAAAAAPPPAPPAPGPAPRPAAKIPFGSEGSIEVHAMSQTWFMQGFDDDFAQAAGTSPYVELGERRSSFRQRRLELKLQGDISKKIGFLAMIDPAKIVNLDAQGRPRADARISVLQDVVVTLRHIPHANVSVGQAKVPISWEGYNSSARLLFVERAEAARLIGDQRDLGIWVHNRFSWIAYHLGVYNGHFANNLDADEHKDVVGRLELVPTPGLLLGGAFQRTLTTEDESARTIAGGDLHVERGPLVFHGEYYWRKVVDGAGAEASSHGAFGQAGWRVGFVQPALRFDYFDPDRDRRKDDYWRLTVGLNVFLGEGIENKIALNYIRTETHSPRDSDLVILLVQAGF
jgi:hypothetical protein